MASTHQLIQYLRARYDEEEAKARTAAPELALADLKAKRTVLDAWEDMDYDVPDYVIEAHAEVYSRRPDYPK